MGGYINLDRGECLNYGISPRQRGVLILRWVKKRLSSIHIF